MLDCVAYPGPLFWRAAVHVAKQTDTNEPGVAGETLFITPHIFDTEDDAIAVAKAWARGDIHVRKIMLSLIRFDTSLRHVMRHADKDTRKAIELLSELLSDDD